jgi:hypothetical protein
MAFGLPAHHIQEHHPGVRDFDHLYDAVVRTVAELEWDLKKQEEEKVVASTGLSLFAPREMIRIEFLSDLSLRITSRCSHPLQVMDWGQNRQNVEDFLVVLNRVLEGG